VRRNVVAWLTGSLYFGLRFLPLPVNRVLLRVMLYPLAACLVRGKADRNLELAFGASMDAGERRRVTRRMLTNLIDTTAELLAFRRHGRRFLDRYVDGADALPRIHALEDRTDGGWIGITGHVGNWELLAQWLNLHTRRGIGGVVARRLPNVRLNALVEDMRGSLGLHTIYRDDSPTALSRVLRSGKGLGLVPDQDLAHVGGLFVDFMGRPAYTPAGPARLAYVSGVPVFVAVALRTPRGLEVRVLAELVADRSRPREEEVARLTREWNAALEAIIRQHPEQWPWFHDRWKTTPDDVAERALRELQTQPTSV
jgi:KDO2-lipid IV(A) lauroyltransferase